MTDQQNEVMTQLAQSAAEQAAVGFFEKIYIAYNQFVSKFPEEYQWLVSLIIIIMVLVGLLHLVRKSLIWIILAIILFPGILPVLKNLFDSLTLVFTGKKLD